MRLQGADSMGKIWKKLLAYLAGNIKISKDDMLAIVDKCDINQDGYISVGEVFEMLRRYIALAKT